MDAGRAGGSQIAGGNALKSELSNSVWNSGRKAGRFGNWFEIVQLFRAMRRMHNPRSNRFDAKTADGSKRGAPHGLRRDIGSELNQSHGVDALRTFRESGNDKFVGGGASGSDEKNFRVLGGL